MKNLDKQMRDDEIWERIKKLEEWKRCYVEELTFQFTEQTKRIKALENPNKDLANDVWIHGRIKALEEWKNGLGEEVHKLDHTMILNRIDKLEDWFNACQSAKNADRLKALEERADAEHDRVTNLYGKTKALEDSTLETSGFTGVKIGNMMDRIKALEESKEHHFTYHEQQQDIIDNRVKALEEYKLAHQDALVSSEHTLLPNDVWLDIQKRIKDLEERIDDRFKALENLVYWRTNERLPNPAGWPSLPNPAGGDEHHGCTHHYIHELGQKIENLQKRQLLLIRDVESLERWKDHEINDRPRVQGDLATRLAKIEVWITNHFSGSFPQNPCPSEDKERLKDVIVIRKQVWEDLKKYVRNMHGDVNVHFTYKVEFESIIKRVELDWNPDK